MVRKNFTENQTIDYCTLIHPPTIPPQIIKQLPISTAKRKFSKNSSSIEILNSAKVEYENAFENSAYHSIKLNFTQTRGNKLTFPELIVPSLPKIEQTAQNIQRKYSES